MDQCWLYQLQSTCLFESVFHVTYPFVCQLAALLKSITAAGYILIKYFSICLIPEVSNPCPTATFENFIAYKLQNHTLFKRLYEGWNFNSGNYLFTTDTK